ncbi:peptide chain release factor N(5)-glutamine methyltransferase [Halobacillus naozhouensis]|uniref:Release factor glutamine methyltransferase n=1 Tax=Halobacillus naozhouensis TaxID=554880 RepID=A0ABY8IYT9_9BACI|nr:peptide chain release factor N(5)-glutamine methyltransferase [Halobacillus naozhouensis]WFT74378.1 peptide chain release factor N(5)-glutamine methyltransferase [Halobacillus naozhouensis]
MNKVPFTTIGEARRWASLFLREHGREVRVADLLLEDMLNLSFSRLLAYEHDSFPETVRSSFIQAIEDHAETGVPVQHLIGKASFYGREFTVNKDVLIPRPETEELVLGTIERIQSKSQLQAPVIADLGTGSGIIAVTLKLEHPASQLIATDLSTDALEIAKRNAEALEADVTFSQGDFLEPVKQQPIDVLVSNPPYISRAEVLQDTVKNFDPELALFAEDDGVAAYQTIIDQIVRFELSPWLIAFEIGHEQGDAVKAIIETRLPDYRVEIKQDINRRDRMIFAELV